MSFERIVQFHPAFDKRHADPSKNYGIHGVQIRFVLKGPFGATQFGLYTSWQLPHVMKELKAKWWGKSGHEHTFDPIPTDLGYHAYEPQYDGQTRMGSCDILPDAEGGCYYDGSTLAAERVFERLLREGDASVWAELEEQYRDRFDVAALTE